MFNLYERYDFDLMRIESEQIEKTLRPVLEAEMVRRQVFFRYDSKPPVKDKESRARSFQYRMRAGNVKFNKEASWYEEYEEELAHFPKWPYKDQVDASAWLGDLVAEEIEAETDEELEEYEYQRMMDADWEFGADPITGY
jgi:predicted phage terminase large subunit-like protein